LTALPPPDAELEEETHVTSDIPCVGCGYNLRTLATQGSCPECGKPVQTSISLAGLKQWPLNAEFACDMLVFGAVVVVAFGIGAVLWLIGSLQLARRLVADDPYALALRWATTLSVVALPITLVFAIFFWRSPVAWLIFYFVLACQYLSIHLIGIRLCRDLELFKQEVCCWALIAVEACAVLVFILEKTNGNLGFLINAFATFCIVWFVFLITTWAWISSDIGKRRTVIEGRHLRRLGKISRKQISSPNPKGSLDH